MYNPIHSERIDFRSVPIIKEEATTSSGTFSDKVTRVTHFNMADVRQHTAVINPLYRFFHPRVFGYSLLLGVLISIFAIPLVLVFCTLVFGETFASKHEDLLSRMGFLLALSLSYLIAISINRDIFLERYATKERGTPGKKLRCVKEKDWLSFVSNVTRFPL
ncbi:MAG: hypothetical protein WCI77_01775 [Candidatus Omnitrophota bacterium]